MQWFELCRATVPQVSGYSVCGSLPCTRCTGFDISSPCNGCTGEGAAQRVHWSRTHRRTYAVQRVHWSKASLSRNGCTGERCCATAALVTDFCRATGALVKSSIDMQRVHWRTVPCNGFPGRQLLPCNGSTG
eukprot:TRINITY_DN19052_c0_g1_i1.p2 TRINITY_DN19052_c0_g1~~TRINITY_DN19052_c0_g1_i1.p2  ORF type:complete len:132 (-),score=5.31 TRINITY_DN19052_c0_g1_i1:227-622(-)